MSGNLEYIRSHYAVPACEGGRVRFTWPAGKERDGTIVGAQDARLLVLLDGDSFPLPMHPTWEIVYSVGADT